MAKPFSFQKEYMHKCAKMHMFAASNYRQENAGD